MATFGDGFPMFASRAAQQTAGTVLTRNLQTLTFGYESTRTCVTMPCSLQSWTFSFRFNLSLRDVMLPSRLQTLTYGYRFNLSLRGVTLTLLRTLTFVDCSGPRLLSYVPAPPGLAQP